MIKGMKDFQLPARLEMDKETASPTYGKFIAEPFERGFGNDYRKFTPSGVAVLTPGSSGHFGQD